MGNCMVISELAGSTDIEGFLRSFENFGNKETNVINVFRDELKQEQIRNYTFKGKTLIEIFQNDVRKRLSTKEMRQCLNDCKRKNTMVIGNDIDTSIGLWIFDAPQMRHDQLPSMIGDSREFEALKLRFQRWIENKSKEQVQNEILQRLAIYPFEEYVKKILLD